MTRFLPRCPSASAVLASICAACLLVAASSGRAQNRAVSDAEVLTSAPLNFTSGPSGEGPLFQEVPAEETGVGMAYAIDPEHPLRRLYPIASATGGAAIGDLNGDGRTDLFFAGGPGASRLFIQTGDFQFYDATTAAGIATVGGWCSGVAMGDIDNDGDLDLYVTVHRGPNLLYINQSREGRAVFEEKGKEWGVDVVDGSLNAAFADFDRDGWLDLYVQTYHLEPETGRPEGELNITVRQGVPLLEEEWMPYFVVRQSGDGGYSWTEAGRPDYLLRNTGQGAFADVTEAAGLLPGRAYGSSVIWTDVDHDGFADLLVGNDGLDPDLFYRNSGRRRFVQGAIRVFPHTPWFTRGTVAADFNNDQLMDVLSANAGPRSATEALAAGFPGADYRAAMLGSGGVPQVFRNALLINAGAARFIDTAWMTGLAQTGAVWNVKAADFDDDGWIDTFFANGSVRDWWSRPPETLAGAHLVGKTRWDLLKDAPERRESNFAFRNLGDLKFADTTAEWGLGHVGMSYASAAGDLDGDGDLDLVVCHAGERVSLYRNRSTANRIRLRLVGKAGNTWGIGAEVLIVAGGKTQMRQLYPQNGSLASDEPVIHFGLGDATRVDRLTIRWPGGAVETFENLAANQVHTVSEANSTIPPISRFRRPKPMFAGTELLGGSGLRKETPELAALSLTPEFLGRLGPGLAWMDLDGDGKDEFYFPGSRNRPGLLVTQDLGFARQPQPFATDALAEDSGAVFFDADNDGDADLFVGSGGPEAAEGAAELRDRLYLNNRLTFSKAPDGHLPDLRDATGPVAAADFDRDGDVDLFVGARLTSGRYPVAPENRLLVNDGGGRFGDAEGEAAAPGLKDSGMASGALWTDIDGDGWLDLIVAHDWGPIRVWKNSAGRLTDISDAAGTALLTGRWNGIAGGDIDQDGDIDYVVTNLGLNTGQSASPDNPLNAWFGDVTGTGQPVLLEAVRDAETGREVPLRSFDEWAPMVPGLKERFADSGAFAAGFDEVFTSERRAAAQRWSVNTLESGILLNDGTGIFRFVPLPRIAQAAPAFGVVMADMNFDGRTDVYLVQNREHAGQSADPADSGLSLLMLGTGNPAQWLQPVWPDDSGIVLFGQGRGAAAVDLNDDDKPDLVAGLNEADPAAFLNEMTAGEFRPFKVSLTEEGRHPAGARVTVSCEGMKPQVAEYHAGGGFLSQSPPTLFFAAPNRAGASAKVTIRWSNGESTERTVYFE